jgi:shikimate dehydrogenase
LRTFGLIGYPLSHSFSKRYFTEKFEEEGIYDCNYELFPLAEVDHVLPLISEKESLCGLNVTIPYKVSVLSFLDEVDEAAAQIGAVNCISIGRKDNKTVLKGYNTDAYGFGESLKPLLKEHHQKALLFGDGGATKAIKYVLTELGIPFSVVVRRPSPGAILYTEVTKDMLDAHTILINTTPLGMSPNIGDCPAIPYQFLSEKHLAYDLVYNPEETLFLKNAAAQGAVVKNGMEMLYLQAERSWHIWNT